MKRKQKRPTRISVLVEGPTEGQGLADFLRRWLERNGVKGVGLDVIPLKGSGRFVQELADKVAARLDASAAGFVFGLLDLYGLPEELRSQGDIDHRIAVARKKITATLKGEAKDKFEQHFAVHETEAWFLAQPEIFPHNITLSKELRKTNPEEINFELPPAKCLEKLFGEKGLKYKKRTMARLLFPRLDPQTAADKCPYLKKFLAALLKRAKGLQGATS